MRDKLEVKVSVVEFADRPNYMLQWSDPLTGKRKTRTSTVERDGTKAAEKRAWSEAGVLQEKLREGAYAATPEKLTWAAFRERYQAEALAALTDGTQENNCNTFGLLERLVSPARLADLTATRLSGFQAKLRELGRREATIKKHLGVVLTALRWARRQKLIREVPEIDMPKRAKAGKAMKGRPITGEEFDRMLAAVSKARKLSPRMKDGRRDLKAERNRRRDREALRRLLRGLWLSGLRLGEALQLRWTVRPGQLCVDLTGRRPMLRIPGECQKSGKDQLHPVAPEFAQWLLATPPEARKGLVFDLLGTGRPMTRNRCSRLVAAVGESAGIVVDRQARRVGGKSIEVLKYASAHDLRRSFGERWASRIMPKVLQELMRHESIDTTMRFYVGRNAESTADVLWAAHEIAAGNKTGNTAASAEKTADGKSAVSRDPKGFKSVETSGLEPPTPALQTRCSPN